MGGIFGGAGNSVKTPKYTEINLQTSTQGVAIPIVYGQNRIGTNVIWYNGFEARTTKVSGKGGILGGGGKEYYYQADVILALCEGPIQNVVQVWAGTTITTLAALGFALFNGSATQEPWSYAVAKYPTQAEAYARTAYVAAAKYQLGSSPDLPSHNFEVIGFFSGTVPGVPDANFADIIADYLTNPQYSIGMATAALNAVGLANYRNATGAAGIFGSPALVNQEQANQTIQRWAQLTNSWIFWSGNQLQFVPLFDSPQTGYGYSYTPQMTPVYNLTYDDFCPAQGEAPVSVDFVDPADGFDRVQVNILDRANYYNNTPMLWSDQTSIDELGELQANIISASEICSQAIGAVCAMLIGKRSVYVNRTYTFKLGRRFIFIEPGDIYTITDPNIGLNQFAVRITSVKSGADRLLTVTAENLPQNIGTAATYLTQAAGGSPAYNGSVVPGNTNPPAIFEPSAALTGGAAQIWIGASGGPDWGGADVLVSFDAGTVYSSVGTISAGVLQGTLVSTLAASADPDTADTLYIDLTESAGIMPSTAAQADADALRTLILVDSEVMAYGTAAPGTLNGYAFDLTYLRRGQYGTAIQTHAVGGEFTKLDLDLIFPYGLPEQYVGQELYFKFPSFNVFGNELEDESTLSAYTYTPMGTAFTLAAPGTPVIAASSVTQADGTTILSLFGSWAPSPGPLLGGYETQWSINAGATWTNDATVGAGAGGAVLSPALAATEYLLRVRAVSQNGAAYSGWVTSAETNSGSLVTTVPAAPTALAASAVAAGAQLSWTASATPGVTYRAFVGTSSTFSAATPWQVQTSATGLLIGGLATGTEYYLWVESINGAGSSAAAGPVTCTPSGLTGEAAYAQGTLLGTGTLTIDAPLTLTGTANPALSFGGIVVQQGTTTLGEFLVLDLGAGLGGTLGAGTVATTLSLSGTLLEAIDGTTTIGGIVGLVAGTNVSISGTTGGPATISAAEGGGGGGPITLTDGSTTLSASELTVNNLDLQALSSIAPTVVQSAYVHGTANNALPANSTVGNLIVLIVGLPTATSGPALSGWTLQSYYDGPNYTRTGVYSKAASGTTEAFTFPSDTVYNSSGIFEVSGVSSATYGAGAMTNSSGVLTYGIPAIGSTASLVLSGISNVAYPISGTYTAPEPSGSTVVNQQIAGPDYQNAMAYLASGSLRDSSSPVLGATFPSPANPGIAYAVLAGEAGSGMQITPTIPVTVNGMAGAFQNLEITTGNTATSVSLSGGTLVINLGTP